MTCTTRHLVRSALDELSTSASPTPQRRLLLAHMHALLGHGHAARTELVAAECLSPLPRALGEDPDWRSVGNDLVAAAHEGGDLEAAAVVTLELAWLQRGTPRRCLDLAREAIQLAEATGSLACVARGWATEGVALVGLGRPEEALDRLEDALGALPKDSLFRCVIQMTMWDAQSALDCPDPVLLAEIEAHVGGSDWPEGRGWLLDRGAITALAAGDIQRARTLYTAAIHAVRFDSPKAAAQARVQLALVEHEFGNWEHAEALLDLAIETFRTFGEREWLALSLESRGRLRYRIDVLAGASDDLAEAATLWAETEWRRAVVCGVGAWVCRSLDRVPAWMFHRRGLEAAPEDPAGVWTQTGLAALLVLPLVVLTALPLWTWAVIPAIVIVVDLLIVAGTVTQGLQHAGTPPASANLLVSGDSDWMADRQSSDDTGSFRP